MRRRLPVLIALFAMALAACSGTTGSSTSALPADEVASVNGVGISAATFEELITAQSAQATYADIEDPSERATQLDELQRQVLTGLIQRELLFQSAAELGVELDDEAFDTQWEALQVQYGGEEGLAKAIGDAGLNVEHVRADVRADLLQTAILDHFSEESGVTDEELQALYDERLETTFQTRTAVHILVETEDEANAIIGLLEDGADFAELARERSTDTGSGANGGELGPAARGAYVGPFDEAVWGAEFGEILGPIETQFGFHVIRVDSEDTVPFEEAATQLRNEVGGQAANAAAAEWFTSFREEAVIVVDPTYGTFNTTTGQVTPVDPLADPTVAPSADPSGAPTEQPTG